MTYIDVAKGIGIILVVLGHCLAYGCQNQLFRCIYSFHMPLFFFLSGYVFRSKDSTAFFAGKIKTLLLPVIFFQTLNLISYSALYGTGSVIGKDLAQFHKFITFGGFWFVITLLYVSSLYFVIYEKIACRFTNKNLLMLSFAIFLLFIGLVYAPSIANKPNQPIATTMTAFFFYTCGAVFKPLFTKINESDGKIKILALIIGLAFSALCFYLNSFSEVNVDFNTSRYGNRLLFVVNALLGTLAVFMISYAISKSKILEWYGTNSLMLLFVHIPLWKFFDVVISHLTSQGGATKSVAVFTISLSLGTLIVWLINRYCPWLTGKIDFSNSKIKEQQNEN